MWFKHRAWIPTAWALSAANLVSVWFAALPGEPAHATLHALLAAALALGARHLTIRRRAEQNRADLQQVLDQNEQLQQNAEEMRARVSELEDRLDFTGRLLMQQGDPVRRDAPSEEP